VPKGSRQAQVHKIVCGDDDSGYAGLAEWLSLVVFARNVTDTEVE
jgi:hypothetical protein